MTCKFMIATRNGISSPTSYRENCPNTNGSMIITVVCVRLNRYILYVPINGRIAQAPPQAYDRATITCTYVGIKPLTVIVDFW